MFELKKSKSYSADLVPSLDLIVTRAKLVSLNLYGVKTESRTSNTVSELMAEKQIVLNEGDSIVDASPETAITKEGFVLNIKNDKREVVTSEEQIPFETETIKDVNKDTSYKVVNQPGSAGLKNVTYEVKKETT